MSKNNSYPDPLAPFEEKKKEAYGVKYANYIQDQWFNGKIIGDGCSHFERREWIRKRRLYAKGLQDQDQYKKIVARQTEDMSFLNLDWRPTNFAGKFVRVVTGGINDDNYSINITALDRLAGQEKNKLKENLTKNLKAKALLQDAKQLLGVDVAPHGYIPEDEEDLKMYLDIKFRPKCEIAEEILINYAFKTNNWHTTKELINEDMTVAGLGVAKVRTDKRNGLQLDYIDPEFFIHSYVKQKDFKDLKYCGHIEPTTIGDLQRNGDFTEAQLRDIAKHYASINRHSINDYETAPFASLLELKVDVLHFNFQTTKELVYKKRKTKHGNFYSQRPDTYNPKTRSDYERAGRVFNTWFEGSVVIGTEHIYNYRECENILTDENDNALPDYIVRAANWYENKPSSFVSEIEPTLDQMHYTLLKLQHLVSEIRPNGAVIDLDMLAEMESVTKGGGKMSTTELLALFQTKGITFSKTANMGDDGVKSNPAVQVLANGVPPNLPHLLEILQDQYQRVRDITGINPFRDGSQNERALVGVQQAAIIASNDTTAHIVNACLDVTKTVAERVSSRLTDIFAKSSIRERYERAVSKENMEVVESLKDRSLHEFGFHVQLKPTLDAIQELNEDLSLALQAQEISVEDKMEAKELAEINIKMAREFLKYIRGKRMKERRIDEMQRHQAKAESDARAAQMAEASRVQAEQQIAQIEVWKYREQAKIDIMVKQQETNIEYPIEKLKLETDLTKEQIRANSADQKTKYVEDQKLKRQNKNNTDHSKMIEQRNEDSGALDFENNNLSFKEILESIGTNQN